MCANSIEAIKGRARFWMSTNGAIDCYSILMSGVSECCRLVPVLLLVLLLATIGAVIVAVSVAGIVNKIVLEII